MHVSIANHQSVARLGRAALLTLAAHLAKRLEAAPGGPWADLTIIVTDDAGITEIKDRCFGLAVATDVISNSYAPVPGDPDSAWSGEVIVNPERALKAARGRWSPSRELALYLAHGIDHLCGGRDRTAKGRRAMRRRELRWLAEAEEAVGDAMARLLPETNATRRRPSSSRCPPSKKQKPSS